MASPVHIGAQRWRPIADQLVEWSERDCDLVWFGGLDHARVPHPLLAPRLQRARWVVDCDDVETEKSRAYLSAGSATTVERVQHRLELPLWQRIQDAVVGQADAVVVCSDLDADRFGPGSTVVVPDTYPELVAERGAPSAPDPDAAFLLLGS